MREKGGGGGRIEKYRAGKFFAREGASLRRNRSFPRETGEYPNFALVAARSSWGRKGFYEEEKKNSPLNEHRKEKNP